MLNCRGHVCKSCMALSLLGLSLSLTVAHSLHAQQTPDRDQTTENIQPVAGPNSATTRGKFKEHVAQLIEQLGDTNFQQRRSAELELTQIGLAAYEQLRESRNHPNVQISTAIEYLIRSQNVTWWLETDRLSVRQVLEDYNDQQETERDTTMQTLANDKSLDALLALCRLARYESSERLAKAAALYLMDAVVAEEPEKQDELVPAIRGTLGPSDRIGCVWIRTLLDGIERDETMADRWQAFTRGEHQLLEQTPSESSNNIVLKLYRWAGTWLKQCGEKELAIAIQRPSLDIIGNRTLQTRQMVLWALESKMPELVEELANRQPEVFAAEPELGFLLAESFRLVGNEQRAKECAETASKGIGDKVTRAIQKQAPNANKVSLDNAIASYRETIADTLITRGMFDWATQQLNEALTGELDVRREGRLRTQLAILHFDGEEYARASEVIEAFLVSLEKRPAEAEKLKMDFNNSDNGELEYLRSNQKFYAGVAAARSGNKQLANELLEQAFQHSAENPDILIELFLVSSPGEPSAFYKENVTAKISAYRTEIFEMERELTNAMRNGRATIIYNLAQSCNQLAWLLAKTKQRPQEAIEISKRSLDLRPNEGVYLDTLARCYFAAGEIDRAIETQKKAIELMPHERALVRQLNEFKAAASEKSSEQK